MNIGRLNAGLVSERRAHYCKQLLLYHDQIMTPKDLVQVFQKQMEEFVKACSVCLKTTIPSKVPLPQTPLFAYPWKKLKALL